MKIKEFCRTNIFQLLTHHCTQTHIVCCYIHSFIYEYWMCELFNCLRLEFFDEWERKNLQTIITNNSFNCQCYQALHAKLDNEHIIFLLALLKEEIELNVNWIGAPQLMNANRVQCVISRVKLLLNIFNNMVIV